MQMANGRLDMLRKKLEPKTGLLIAKEENRRYLSNFSGSSGWLLITLDRQGIITDFRYHTQVREQAPQWELIDRGDNLYERLKETCDAWGIEQLIFEEDYLPYLEVRKIKESMPQVLLINREGLVEEQRMIKDDGEIVKIRKAGQIAADVFSALQSYIQDGLTEIEIADRIELLLKEKGSRENAFTTIVAAGENAAKPHGLPSERPLRNGDLVVMDYGAVVEGYRSDITRTVAIGDIDREFERIYNIVKDAQLRALEAIKPGITGKEVDKVARDYISDYGYGEYFGHGLGHGVGLNIHENPRLSPQSEVALEEGMVVTVEPGIYIPGRTGVRIEDLVLVTRDGCEILTDVTKELLVIRRLF